MRNNLPERCQKYECGVINLDDDSGLGTHWVSYCIQDKTCYYFDSFGDLQPFEEFVKYVSEKCTIHFNYRRYQKSDSVNCGHLCLKFLFGLMYHTDETQKKILKRE